MAPCDVDDEPTPGSVYARGAGGIMPNVSTTSNSVLATVMIASSATTVFGPGGDGNDSAWTKRDPNTSEDADLVDGLPVPSCTPLVASQPIFQLL
ncbi:hypothetical protein C6341_g23370 [Phytophthora cactorum]|nr:hypothetical protein PC120_g23067 [Phytophthora cactorum]KAG3131344.1 hypothetical protein C6341_g23370 [Phytophthora cactorum]